MKKLFLLFLLLFQLSIINCQLSIVCAQNPYLPLWANAVFTAMTECHCDRAEGSKSGSVICDGGKQRCYLPQTTPN